LSSTHATAEQRDSGADADRKQRAELHDAEEGRPGRGGQIVDEPEDVDLEAPGVVASRHNGRQPENGPSNGDSSNVDALPTNQQTFPLALTALHPNLVL
jgi:hypothetical protein